MSLDPVKELGKTLGKMSGEQETIKQQMTADELDAQETLYTKETIEITGSITIRKKTYLDDSFIIDHPVRCDIDSAYYQIDGGYVTGVLEFTGGYLTFTDGYLTFVGGTETLFTGNY